MQLITCPVCGEVNEFDDDDLASGESPKGQFCGTCESPLDGHGSAEAFEHAMDAEEALAACRSRRARPLSAELVEELTVAVQVLADQVRCLRLAIDEIEAELGWAIRSRVLPQLQPPAASPAEPQAASVEPLPVARAQPPRPACPAVPAQQGNLW